MPVREILILGDPGLLRPPDGPAQKINIFDPAVYKLAQDLIETCQKYGALGLAATQIGVNKHMAVVRGDILNLQHVEYEVLINAQWCTPWEPTSSDGLKRGYEMCLSVPGVKGKVERYDHIKLKYTDLNELKREVELRDFKARVAQHELDHLDNRLWIDHTSVSMLKRAQARRKMKKLRKRMVRNNLKYADVAVKDVM